jgi:hypothetical protein
LVVINVGRHVYEPVTQPNQRHNVLGKRRRDDLLLPENGKTIPELERFTKALGGNDVVGGIQHGLNRHMQISLRQHRPGRSTEIGLGELTVGAEPVPAGSCGYACATSTM